MAPFILQPRRFPTHATLLPPALLLIALVLPGCAGRSGPRPGTPPGAPAAGYAVGRDSLPASRLQALAGRRIVIDPGHGGVFRGSLGVGGLAEADVNLGVALRLRERLRAAGAEVLLTRETDRDFLTPADSSLRSDLAERSRIANAFGAELFVSVHHNADAGGRHDVNETQTYWRLDDPGASFDAGADVHRALVRGVGIGADRLLPGNYAVLRQSVAPAILTESSYLTYPPTEARLRDPGALQIEADALCAGLAAYFARESPRVEGFIATDADTDAVGRFMAPPRLRAGIVGAYDEVELLLDGTPLPVERHGAVVEAALPESLPDGAHAVVMRARLGAEGASPLARLGFVVARRVARLELSAPYQAAWAPNDDALALRLVARAADGSVARTETLHVRVRTDAGARPADTTFTLAGGEGWLYLTRDLRARGRVVAARSRAEAAGLLPGACTVAIGTAPRVVDVAGFARDVEGAPLRGMERADALGACNPDGFGRFRRFVAFGGAAAAEWTPGWRRVPLAAERDGGERLASDARSGFVAWFGGALAGRRIAVDAAGDGDVPGRAPLPAAERNASGTRAADVNLEVARTLVAMLRACGADARLVRAAPAPMLDVDRVRVAEAFAAERYLRIARSGAAPRLVGFAGSGSGRRWAEHVAAACESLGVAQPQITEGAEWVLQQTSCPALRAELAPLGEGAPDPAALRDEAYRLLAALALEFGAAPGPAAEVGVLDDTGQPVPAVPIAIGDALVLLTGADGRVRFLRSEPGAIMLAVGRDTGIRREILPAHERAFVVRDWP